MKGYFVTATDTDAGKTTFSCALLQFLAHQGHRTAAMKPIASGAERADTGLRNADALRLQAMATELFPYEAINPYCFEPAIAPHLAAQAAGVAIDIPAIVADAKTLAAMADVLVVEGAGGWRVPLSQKTTIADLALAVALPVILVVPIRLGCLNHALLTWRDMQSMGVSCAGWVANCIDPSTSHLDEQIATLTHWLGAAPIAVMPFYVGGVDDTALDIRL